MQVRYACTYWGLERASATLFLARTIADGFDGVEINLPEDRNFVSEFQSTLEGVRSSNPDFIFIAQQVLGQAIESPAEYRARLKARLEALVELKPDFINSHTGKDHFSFDDNCRAIEIVENVSEKSGIPIYHETHRGRFTFHAASLLPYLDKFPQLKLTADFSHWCTVSESLLQDQQNIIAGIIPYVRHVHARIGYEHSPQVNDPFAPEWRNHIDAFMGWWKQIAESHQRRGDSVMTVTPEFGPEPYMPTIPYSRKPLSDQWQTNVQIKDLLKRKANF